MTGHPPEPAPTFFDAVGGSATFRALVDAFYARVHEDPVLLPLYPPDELADAPERLRMFLEQYWGGPKTYGEQRGHPRLRMRHVIFRIGDAERDAWLDAMRAAMDTLDLTPEQDAQLWTYLQTAAHSLVNTTTGETAGPVGPTDASPLSPEPGSLLAQLTDRPEPGRPG